jgi:hypothetical protein
MLPVAHLSHWSDQRLRLRIRARQGDSAYFESLARKLTAAFANWSVTVNAMTGSILVTGPSPEPDLLDDFGRREKAFSLEAGRKQPPNLGTCITAPLHAVNRQLKQMSGGRVDLPAAFFISLLAFGAIELLRGKWRTPPWYTAFWYAFGLYSKSLLDQPTDAGDIGPDGD